MKTISTCREMDQALERYLNGNEESTRNSRKPASSTPPGAIEHLEGCERCRERWDKASAFEALLAEIADDAPTLSRAAHQRILDAIEREPAPRRSASAHASIRQISPARWIPLAAAAAVLLVVGIVAIQHHLRRLDTPDRRQVADVQEPIAASIPNTDAMQYEIPTLSLTALLEPAWMLEGVNEDLSWFTKALLSHPESFLRAVGAPLPGDESPPTGSTPSTAHYRG